MPGSCILEDFSLDFRKALRTEVEPAAPSRGVGVFADLAAARRVRGRFMTVRCSVPFLDNFPRCCAGTGQQDPGLLSWIPFWRRMAPSSQWLTFVAIRESY